MANLVITAANVKKSATNPPATNVIVWGEAVVEGQIVYESTDQKYYLLDASADWSVAAAENASIALSGGAAGQSGIVAGLGFGEVTLGAGVMTKGQVFVVDGVAPGGIKTADQLAAGEYLIMVGHAVDDSVLGLYGKATTDQKA